MANITDALRSTPRVQTRDGRWIGHSSPSVHGI